MFDAIFLAPDDRHYFFWGVHCWQFDMANTSVTADQPTLIHQDWPGVPLASNAACRGEGRFAGKVFFFLGSHVWRFDMNAGRVDPDYPKVTHELWPGFFFGAIDHAVSYPSGDMMFVQGDHVLRYDHAADAVDGAAMLGLDAITKDRRDLGDAVFAGGPARPDMLFVFDGAKYDRLTASDGKRNGTYPRDWNGVFTGLPTPRQCERLAEAADGLVGFARNPGPGRWTSVTHAQILAGMAARVLDVDAIQQRTTQFCGPAAIIHWQCSHRLRDYIDNCVEIFQSGEFDDFEGGTYSASAKLRAGVFDTPMAAVDWMYMATLRETENWLLSVDGDGGKVAEGLTTVREMRRYCRKVLGLPVTKREKTYRLGERKALLMAEEAVKDGGAGFLMIRNEMLRGERTQVPWPTHWIVLLGNTRIDDGHPLRPDDGHYDFDIWTSSGRRSLSISEKVFEDSMYGAVAAWPG